MKNEETHVHSIWVSSFFVVFRLVCRSLAFLGAERDVEMFADNDLLVY